MSAAEAARQAARFTDPVEHSLGMLGMLAGMVLGAVVGAILIAATVATGGGALALALAVVGAVGATAGTGLAGEQLANGLSTLLGGGGIVTGNLQPACSPNVHVGGKASARAKLDGANCNGLFFLNHFPSPMELIATGSTNVYINRMPAARQGDKLVCGADIKQGWATVRIGGGTVRVLPIHDNEAWLHDILCKVALASLAAAALLLGGGYLAGAICGAAVLEAVGVGVAFFAGNELLGEIGDALGPGWRDTLQGAFGVGASMFAGYAGLRSIETGRPLIGEPVDAVTGEVCMWKTDFELPGALPLTLKRSYASGSLHNGCFGPRWSSTWGQWVEVEGNVATWYTDDGRRIEFTLPPEGDAGWVRNPLVDQVRLRRAMAGFEVRIPERRILRFAARFSRRWQLSAIEEANRRSIRFTYDETGALRRVEHSGGYRLGVQGSASQVQRVALAGAHGEIELVRYEYDESGRLAAVIDGSGVPFRYLYDEQGRVVRWEDRLGAWYDYVYDARGRCIQGIGPDRMYHYQFGYDEAARTNTATDSTGGVTAFVYNERMQVVERRDAAGGVARTDWDERSNKLREVDAAGRTVERGYDPDGRVTLVRDGLGRVTRTRYDALARSEELTDPQGGVWRRLYDERDNLVEASGPDGAAWTYERDAAGDAVRVVDPAGNARRFGYDAAGLLVWVLDARNARTRIVRDELGRVVERVDALGHRVAFAYNAQGKLASAEWPDGSRFAWEYDAAGNLARRVGPGGREYLYSHGAFDLLLSVRKPSGSRIAMQYDTEGRLASVRNGLDQFWRIAYNATGQVLEERDFSGRVQRFEYDASGACTRRVNGQGEAVALEWDAARQLVRKSRSDGGVSEFEYDPLGLLARARNDDVEVRFERDSFGRVLRERQGEKVVESLYDPRGLRVKRRTDGAECEWQWDANGQVAGMRLPGDEWLQFEHDALGQEVERRMHGGLMLHQDHDPVGRLRAQWAGLETVPPSAPVVQREYIYSASGDPLEIRDRRWGRVRFTYDPDGRITLAERDGGRREAFEYDAAGNIARAGLQLRLQSNGGRLERAGETSYVYDGDGRVIEKRQGDRTWRYEWDPEGRLRGMETPAGGYWRYAYDAFGRRVSKHGPRGAVEYLWDGPVVIEEAGNGKASQWEYVPGSFRPLVQRQGGRTYAVVTDQAGAPRELLDPGGAVAWRAQWTVWGEEEEVERRKTDCPLRFPGQWWDRESGLHYNFKRYYDPEAGQYLTPDPTGLLGGTRSYGYVHNPLTWVDPLGLNGNPATSTHITYVGVKDGQPYVGYASMPGDQPGADVLRYRYSNNFDAFETQPDVIYRGYGLEGKQTARGLEQRLFEDYGGLQNTANAQNPVGPGNPNRDVYLSKADAYRAANPEDRGVNPETGNASSSMCGG